MRKNYFIYEVQTNNSNYMREFNKISHFNSKDLKIFEEMEERNASTHVFSYLMKQDDMILIRVYVNIDKFRAETVADGVLIALKDLMNKNINMENKYLALIMFSFRATLDNLFKYIQTLYNIPISINLSSYDRELGMLYREILDTPIYGQPITFGTMMNEMRNTEKDVSYTRKKWAGKKKYIHKVTPTESYSEYASGKQLPPYIELCISGKELFDVPTRSPFIPSFEDLFADDWMMVTKRLYQDN